MNAITLRDSNIKKIVSLDTKNIACVGVLVHTQQIPCGLEPALQSNGGSKLVTILAIYYLILLFIQLINIYHYIGIVRLTDYWEVIRNTTNIGVLWYGRYSV